MNRSPEIRRDDWRIEADAGFARFRTSSRAAVIMAKIGVRIGERAVTAVFGIKTRVLNGWPCRSGSSRKTVQPLVQEQYSGPAPLETFPSVRHDMA